MSDKAWTPIAKALSSRLPVEYLAFKLGSQEYGLDIQTLQELRGFDSVTRIANAKDYVMGVINLHSVIVPIVDLRIKLQVGRVVYDHFTAVIILNVCQRVIGVVVDGVSDVAKFRREQIQQAPQSSNMLESNYLFGVGTVEERTLKLIDIEALLGDADFGVIDRLAA